MLILSMQPEQAIRIGETIVVRVLRVGRRSVTLGIDAPPDVPITRDPRNAADALSRRSGHSQPTHEPAAAIAAAN